MKVKVMSGELAQAFVREVESAMFQAGHWVVQSPEEAEVVALCGPTAKEIQAVRQRTNAPIICFYMVCPVLMTDKTADAEVIVPIVPATAAERIIAAARDIATAPIVH